ncbi:glycosyltransferase family 4 protein [Planococcus maritimus]|uniref:glycosyltransferase family 4 protein n=1 Tax=Planococcus maritimus TaxID=192421 RepID=UPI00079AD2FD|nr:glycosyltransferase family 4 protein [Planococcus maritimus]KYG59432.1 glycosyl transferase [Planococcus maritimus]
MKVLILSNNDIGILKFRRELIQELTKKNETFIAIPEGNFNPKIRDLKSEIIDIPLSRRGMNPLNDFALFIKYFSLIKKINPDVVLTYTIKPNIYGGLAASLNKARYISNITGLGTAVEKNGFLQKITIFLYRLGLKQADTVFFQNKSNKNFFDEKKIVAINSRIIPGSGVNLDHYQVLKYPTTEKTVFLFIGRVIKEKGIDQYLEAAVYIKKKYQNVEFHILGAADEKYIKLLGEMSREGTVVYHGRKDDIREFHKISHCTIHPSYYPEGMSNVLLESAASGRPIITTNRPGCKEVVDDGVNGFIFKEVDTQDLIQKIEKFISLDYKSKKNMGLAGREKVEREFSRSIVVDEYLKAIYK